MELAMDQRLNNLWSINDPSHHRAGYRAPALGAFLLVLGLDRDVVVLAGQRREGLIDLLGGDLRLGAHGGGDRGGDGVDLDRPRGAALDADGPAMGRQPGALGGAGQEANQEAQLLHVRDGRDVAHHRTTVPARQTGLELRGQLDVAVPLRGGGLHVGDDDLGVATEGEHHPTLVLPLLQETLDVVGSAVVDLVLEGQRVRGVRHGNLVSFSGYSRVEPSTPTAQLEIHVFEQEIPNSSLWIEDKGWPLYFLI